VVNLVINAAEASQEKKGAITVRTGMVELQAKDLLVMHRAGERRPGVYLFLEVEDEGVGFPSESLKRIFDPFFSTKFVGRGLGLASVFRIVASHEGAIDVRTAPGRGMTMRLLFPELAGPLPIASSPEPAARSRPSLAGRLLVVDDDRMVREVTVDLCGRLGLEVASAGSGEQALALLARAEESFAAVLLDLSMPGMGGLEVLSRLRALHPGLPVLVMSGYADRLPAEAPDGVTTFLRKPFSLDALARALEGVLQGTPRP
jgi:CheY-like chemotaxis protein